MSDEAPLFLTTREVAELLRVRERKVYDLAAEGAIPHRRLTGKLLFPRDALMEWMAPDTAPRPPVLAGSHDPLLDWAVRECGSGLALLSEGSAAGLSRFARGEAMAAGLHLPEPGGWNEATVAAEPLREAVLITWAHRTRGLILGPAFASASTLSDLAGARLATRSAGTGTAALWERLKHEAGLSDDALQCVGPAHSESDAAALVAEGGADVTLGLASMAAQFSLRFAPLITERFDLLLCRRAAFTPPLQRLLDFARGPQIREKAEALGGYDLRETGTVRWLSR
ncbi:helix-turn-helix transcriptional regulator [Cognatishimia sp. F0-27]|uniref:helix-turn-helix transcriptional regulator n=1 Tax=Cognatishimia sp. F0-27 TaxID=2816855 RepID=UPI001D0C622F|nr:helix-turn-helix transcriptional regulator [Cognatishimia sp. F0-27]MCC1492217.1 helix-turn-helix transcriptional regulator [Cognatishimia sp. F0-27]